MNWNLAFWSFAFAVMTTIVVLVVRAIGFARRGDVERHRRSIHAAAVVVVGFVAAYGGKLAFLGREDKSDWTRTDLTILYTHEALVGIMLLTAVIGATIGRTLYRLREAGQPLPSGRRNVHRLIGRTCAIAASLALITGGAVLYRMIARILAS